MELSSGHPLQSSSSERLHQASKNYFSPGKLWNGKKITDKALAVGAAVSYGTIAIPIIMEGIKLGTRKYESSKDLPAKFAEHDDLPSFENLQKRLSNPDDYTYKRMQGGIQMVDF